MAFVHGKAGRVLVNSASLTADFKGYTVTHKRDMADSTVMTGATDVGHKFIPGLFEGTINLEGNFDSAAGRAYATLSAQVGVDNGVKASVWPEGNSIGSVSFFCQGDITEFESEAEVDDIVPLTVEVEADEMVDMGHIHAFNVVTSTGNLSSVDGAVATANGGGAMLHVTAASGTTPSLTVKVQHSSDNSTFADLITFTAATAVTSEFKTAAAGTAVNRYTRASHTVSGTSPSFTYALSFARR